MNNLIILDDQGGDYSLHIVSQETFNKIKEYKGDDLERFVVDLLYDSEGNSTALKSYYVQRPVIEEVNLPPIKEIIII